MLQNKEESRRMQLSLADKTKDIDTLEMQLVDSRSQIAALGKCLLSPLRMQKAAKLHKRVEQLQQKLKQTQLFAGSHEDAADKLASGMRNCNPDGKG